MSKIVNHNYSQRTEPAGGFKTLDDFYPFYLGEHCNQINRRLHITGTVYRVTKDFSRGEILLLTVGHIIGTTLSQLIIAYAIIRQKWKWILAAVVQGYAWAWVGHFVFEKK
jgi:hypothetical protein